jgi:hypothetical protein
MSLRGTFERYNPVTIGVGCGFVACGLWIIFELVLHGVRTAVGGVVLVLFAAIPVSLGVAIIHNQVRLRRNSK